MELKTENDSTKKYYIHVSPMFHVKKVHKGLFRPV